MKTFGVVVNRNGMLVMHIVAALSPASAVASHVERFNIANETFDVYELGKCFEVVVKSVTTREVSSATERT